jgi:hypothetical protein
LILDCFAAHRAPWVKVIAAALNIVLHFVPLGLTDEWQPLDCAVYAVLKALTRKKYGDHVASLPPDARVVVTREMAQ